MGRMQIIQSQGCALHVQVDGPPDGPVLMFSNSLGTDLRVWTPLIARLPEGLRLVRYDKRGHGLSDCPAAPYDMDTLVADAAAVADAVGVREVTFVGLSIGGLIGQGLAQVRPDLINRLVLMDTAAKIGSHGLWADRIAGLRADGLEVMADAVMARWFAPAFRADPARLAPWRNMLTRTPLEGYIGCCHAIAGADLRATTPKLTIPIMAMAGAEDNATPPELVKATADMCQAPFHLIKDAGHLPCVEKPDEIAALVAQFMAEA